MPEIPEIETTRAALTKELVGKKIKAVAVTNGKLVSRHKTAKDFRARVEGRTIKSFSRLGRNLIVALDDSGHWVIDPGPVGLLLRSKGPKDVKPKHTHVVVSFQQGPDLRLIDPLAACEMFASERPPEGTIVKVNVLVDRLALSDDGRAIRRVVPELATIGLDLLLDQFGWDRLGIVFEVAKRPVKEVLTNQKLIAGFSSTYIDEALFAAGVRAERSSEEVSQIETRRLHRALVEIVSEAVKVQGSTVEPENWTDPDGRPGGFQEFLQVVGREGERCTQCRETIRAERTKTGTTFFCPSCQA
jgi:formamidopyrimidine-DNA glycosylase